MSKVETKILEDGAKWFDVSEKENTVGFAVAYLQNDEIVLDNIHVQRRSRGKGHGSRLIKKVVEWAKETGADKVVGNYKPENTPYDKGNPVLNFYERNGFKIEDGRVLHEINQS